MFPSAEKNLKDAVFKGEAKKFNFEMYVRIHINQHQILNDLKEHRYAGIDERSKVSHLTDVIKNTALDSVKNTILVSATLCSDFIGCVALFKDFIHQSSTQSDTQSLQIAQIETGKKNK